MAILKTSWDINKEISYLSQETKKCTQEQIDEVLQKNDTFQTICKIIKKLLKKDDYLIIKNIGFINNKSFFQTLIKYFGDFYGIIECLSVKLDCKYTGCSHNPIELHNDDAIDLNDQPLYGFMQIQNEDPLKLTKNGLVKINDIVNFLKTYDNDFLEELLKVKIKMLSYGTNYSNRGKKKIITNATILYRNGENINVRFDLDRIKFFYFKENLIQDNKEIIFINKFLSIAKKFRKEFYLEKEDILIFNNKKTLHDRTECSLELNMDGSFNTREIFVSFAREIK